MTATELIARVRELNAPGNTESTVNALCSLATLAPLLADALERALAEREWQPIETAPRDGTPLLLWFAGAKVPVVGYYKPSQKTWHTFDHGRLLEPTHWMPLPNPPTK